MEEFVFGDIKKRPASFAGLFKRKKYLLFDDDLTEVITGTGTKLHCIDSFSKSTDVY